MKKALLSLGIIIGALCVCVGCKTTPSNEVKNDVYEKEVVENEAEVEDEKVEVPFLVEDSETVSVKLESVGDSKIKVISAIRDITGLGLADAKALVDVTPSVIKEGVSQEEAEALKAKLVEAGATVIIE